SVFLRLRTRLKSPYPGLSESGYSLRVRESRIPCLPAAGLWAMPCPCGSGHLRVREVDCMRKPHRSFLLALLLPAFLFVGVFAVVQAQEGKSPAAKAARWSDAATWPDRKVPRAGDKVTIPAGKDVILDV